MRFPIVILSAFALTCMSASLSAADKITHTENDLLAAGFVSRNADTPERAAMLARLPSRKFVRHAHDSGLTTYVYADEKNCNCLYVGSEAAYGVYRKQQQAADIASENAFAAEDYRDAAWDWGAWGPFDGAWGGYGFHSWIGW